MKKTKLIRALCACAALPFFLLTACDAPTNSDALVTYDKNTADTATDEIPTADTSKNTDTEAEREEAKNSENSGDGGETGNGGDNDNDATSSGTNSVSESLSPISTDERVNYDASKLSVTNDGTNLTVTLSFEKEPAFWENDRVAIMIDDTSIGSEPSTYTANDWKNAASYQSVDSSVEFYAQDFPKDGLSGSPMSKSHTWTQDSSTYVYTTGGTTLTYTIALSDINSSAKQDDTFRIVVLVSNYSCSDNKDCTFVQDALPSSAVTVTKTDGDNDTVNIAFENALEVSGVYTVDALDDFDDFVLGFDASAVDYYEKGDDGNPAVTWKDTDGTETEFFTLLKKHGVNTVRLRIWNDPSQKIQGSVPVGDNTLECTIAMAKRVKSAGLKLMLDFHYSDTWADPSKQIVPHDWQSLTSTDAVATAISEYTTEVLTELKTQADVTPYYVQIGNEINNGLLLHTGYNASTDDGSGNFTYAAGNDSTNVVTYLKAASKAVRDFNGNIRIVVHVASSNEPTKLLNTLKNGSLDYDVIGLSYYPRLKSHGTIANFKQRISDWTTTYNKQVIVAECAFDGACDTSEAVVARLKVATENLIDPKTNSVYSDLTYDSTNAYIIGSPENQHKAIKHIMDESADSGAIGICTWGGEMRDWEHGMFTWAGQAFVGIDVFNEYGN